MAVEEVETGEIMIDQAVTPVVVMQIDEEAVMTVVDLVVRLVVMVEMIARFNVVGIYHHT